MVIRELNTDPFYLKIDNRWIYVSKSFLAAHPGGSAITTYRNRDATQVFHSFHVGSKRAYTLLREQPNVEPPESIIQSATNDDGQLAIDDDINVDGRHFDKETIRNMNADFNRLRSSVRRDGLLDAPHSFYIRKVFECLAMIGIAIVLQTYHWFIVSALVLGLAWQQLGWMIHEYTHHQHFKVRFIEFSTNVTLFIESISQRLYVVFCRQCAIGFFEWRLERTAQFASCGDERRRPRR